MKKITPFLWFEDRLEEAFDFYVSVFPDAEIRNVMRQGPDGPVFSASFRLFDQDFMGLNGGPAHAFSDAVSFFVSCKDQEEVDYYWEKLTADGGKELQCGWLRDKFGLAWQIIPEALTETLQGADPEGAQRAMQAMLEMKKIVVADLRKAYAGG